MAFICNECGKIFYEPGRYEEKHEFWGAPCSETFYVCPACNSEDFDEYTGDTDGMDIYEDYDPRDEPEYYEDLWF